MRQAQITLRGERRFAAPYFCAGYIITLALANETAHVPKLYFINLTGSGVGCFLIFATLSPLGAAGTLLVIAAVGGLIALLTGTSKVLRGAGGLGALALLGLVPISESVVPFR